MPDAHDLQQQSRTFWERAGALSLMFHRRSKSSARWSFRLSWGSIGCGALTGVAGVFTATMDPSVVLGLTTGLLGVGTGTINTIRERVIPADRAGELWSLRNDAAGLQERFGDIFVEVFHAGPDLGDLPELLRQAREELLQAEANSLANQLESEDKAQAGLYFRQNPRFSSVALKLGGGLPEAAEQVEASPAGGMTRPVRGGAA